MNTEEFISENQYERLFVEIEKKEHENFRSKKMPESQMAEKIQKLIEDFLR